MRPFQLDPATPPVHLCTWTPWNNNRNATGAFSGLINTDKIQADCSESNSLKLTEGTVWCWPARRGGHPNSALILITDKWFKSIRNYCFCIRVNASLFSLSLSLALTLFSFVVLFVVFFPRWGHKIMKQLKKTWRRAHRMVESNFIISAPLLSYYDYWQLFFPLSLSLFLSICLLFFVTWKCLHISPIFLSLFIYFLCLFRSVIFFVVVIAVYFLNFIFYWD